MANHARQSAYSRAIFNDYRMLRIDQTPSHRRPLIKSARRLAASADRYTAAPPAVRNAIYAGPDRAAPIADRP